jgi:hypothetical protein
MGICRPPVINGAGDTAGGEPGSEEIGIVASVVADADFHSQGAEVKWCAPNRFAGALGQCAKRSGRRALRRFDHAVCDKIGLLQGFELELSSSSGRVRRAGRA